MPWSLAPCPTWLNLSIILKEKKKNQCISLHQDCRLPSERKTNNKYLKEILQRTILTISFCFVKIFRYMVIFKLFPTQHNLRDVTNLWMTGIYLGFCGLQEREAYKGPAESQWPRLSKVLNLQWKPKSYPGKSWSYSQDWLLRWELWLQNSRGMILLPTRC